ncbi:hypothetical protein LDENG_00269050 [Lucifuga dentata]|nr:hypothetical protein LDENG_00269050 [Lucifuga dentata]
MSKSLKKKNHWTNKVHEAVITRGKEGDLGFELKGGAENGQFPYFGEVKQGKALIQSGKLAQDELLLEVNDMPVAGLTTRDVLAVIKHCKDPVRFKCVKQAGGSRRLFISALLVQSHSLEGVCPFRRDATACGFLLILVEDRACLTKQAFVVPAMFSFCCSSFWETDNRL